ncbi:hypothetical protein ACFHW0_10405 [Micromonospora sp. LOL_025]|uniref:hypothetical protein n=1 Tax=Micromonospora sp. LOL_025 TaxID=3345413 RepID=UPI003A8946EB
MFLEIGALETPDRQIEFPHPPFHRRVEVGRLVDADATAGDGPVGKGPDQAGRTLALSLTESCSAVRSRRTSSAIGSVMSSSSERTYDTWDIHPRRCPMRARGT